MCNNVKKTQRSLFYTAAIFTFFAFSCACIGSLVYSKNPNLALPEIIPFLLNNYCPTGLKGLLGAGLLAMSISTVESFFE